jgi:hypothetical protein
MKIAVLGILMFLQAGQQAPKAKPVDSISLVPFTINSFLPSALVEIDAYDGKGGTALILPPAIVTPDGHKIYTITTKADWTCTPTDATSNSATIVCVKSDDTKK